MLLMKGSVFEDLLSGTGAVAEIQRRAAEGFLAAAESSGFLTSVPQNTTPHKMVVGVASYSLSELRMLDQLRERMRIHEGLSQTSVVVFDVLNCLTEDDFEKFVPGIGRVLQTPVIGYWIHGVVIKLATGFDAVEFLNGLFTEPLVDHDLRE